MTAAPEARAERRPRPATTAATATSTGVPHILAALVLQGCGFGGSEPDRIADSAYVSDLTRLGQEQTKGAIGLEPAPNGQTRVLIEMSSPPANRIEAEIQTGNCDTFGTAVYPLNPVVDGASETTVNATVAHLRRTGYNVIVGRLGTELGAWCADLHRSQPPGATPTFD